MDMFVGRLMTAPVETVLPDASMQEAASRMRGSEIGSLLVCDELDRLEGILTTTDFVSAAAAGDPVATTPVSEHMSTGLTTATANDDIHEVAETMVDAGFHHVPVVDDVEGVVGIITTTDLAEYLSHVEVADPGLNEVPVQG